MKKTPMPAKKNPTSPVTAGDFDSLVSAIVHIHQQTQDFAAKAVNIALTLRNWLIGYRIVEFEQQGNDRAAYGERLMDSLALRLAGHGLTRVTPRELRRYRQLYLVYPHIWESLAPKSLAQQGFGPLLHLLPPSSMPIRESVTPESEKEEAATPDAFRHEHLGQLNTYVAYYKKHQMTPGDQPPIGILLCTRKNDALVEFALGDLSNQVFVAHYAVELPKKEDMERFIAQLGKEVGA